MPISIEELRSQLHPPISIRYAPYGVMKLRPINDFTQIEMENLQALTVPEMSNREMASQLVFQRLASPKITLEEIQIY